MGTTFAVRLTPRGGADRIEGTSPDGELRVRVAAAPVDGAANRRMIALVADALGVAPSRITIDAGAASRRKRLIVEGVDANAVTARWPGVVATPHPARVDALRGTRG